MGEGGERTLSRGWAKESSGGRCSGSIHATNVERGRCRRWRASGPEPDWPLAGTDY